MSVLRQPNRCILPMCMTKRKYQISEKAQYISMQILKDELEYFDIVLSARIYSHDAWLLKLRQTRAVFVPLNNVKDAAEKWRNGGDRVFFEKTRNLKKKLGFAKHFRNQGVGHLNNVLAERAAQWSPQIFSGPATEDPSFQIIESYRAVIESCINSYVDEEDKQKVFRSEIDLYYPPDASRFFTYLAEIVKNSIDWVSGATLILQDQINFHNDDMVSELAVVAGKTNFNMKEASELSLDAEESMKRIQCVFDFLDKEGVDTRVLDLIRLYFFK